MYTCLSANNPRNVSFLDLTLHLFSDQRCGKVYKAASSRRRFHMKFVFLKFSLSFYLLKKSHSAGSQGFQLLCCFCLSGNFYNVPIVISCRSSRSSLQIFLADTIEQDSPQNLWEGKKCCEFQAAFNSFATSVTL